MWENVEKRGAGRRDAHLLSLKNKPFPARKQEGKAQETRYRKHYCTRNLII